MTSNKEDGVNYTGMTIEGRKELETQGKIKPKKKEKETNELDLNGDGKVNEKDFSIAGKVLAKSRRKKVK